MGARIDVQVDVRPAAGDVGKIVQPQRIPAHVRRGAELVGQRERLRIQRVVFVDDVFSRVDGALIILPGGGRFRIILGEFRFADGVSVLVHKDLCHRVAHRCAVAVVFGQIPEIQGLLGHIQIKRLNGIHILLIFVQDCRFAARADGDGIAHEIVAIAGPGDLVVVRQVRGGKVQADGQIETLFFHGGLQIVPLVAVSVFPALLDGQVDRAEAAVGHGEAREFEISQLFKGIDRLVFVVQCGEPDGAGKFVAVGQRVRGIGDRGVADLCLENVDVVDTFVPDSDQIVPVVVFTELNGADQLIGRFVEHGDRHRLAVLDVALVDPFLAHQNDGIFAFAVVYGGKVVAVFVALGIHLMRLSVLLQQQIFVLLAFGVELRQAGDQHMPLPELFDREEGVVDNIFPDGGRGVAGILVDRECGIANRLRAAGRAEQGKSVLAGIPVFRPFGSELFRHVVLDHVCDGVGDDRVVRSALGGCRFALVNDFPAALREREGAGVPAYIGFYGRASGVDAVFHFAALPDRFLDPPVFQFPALRVILRIGTGVGDGEILRYEIEEFAGVFGVRPLLGAFVPGLKTHFHHDVPEFRLEGSCFPVLRDGDGHGAFQTVGQCAAVVEERVVVVARRILRQSVGDGAVRRHAAEHLFVEPGVGAAQIFAHDIAVAVALGVILREGLDVVAGTRKLDRVQVLGGAAQLGGVRGAVGFPDKRGRTVRFAAAVAPQLKDGIGALGRVVVQPDLGGLVGDGAGQRQLQDAAAVHGICDVAETGHRAVVITDSEIIALVEAVDPGQTVVDVGFGRSLANRIGDAGVVQIVPPQIRYGDRDQIGRCVGVIAEVAVVTHGRQLEVLVPVACIGCVQIELFQKRLAYGVRVMSGIALIHACGEGEARLQNVIGAVLVLNTRVIAGIFRRDLHHCIVLRRLGEHHAPADIARNGASASRDVRVCNAAGQALIPGDLPDAALHIPLRLRHRGQAQIRQRTFGQCLVRGGAVECILKFIAPFKAVGAFVLGVAVVRPVDVVGKIVEVIGHGDRVIGERGRIVDEIPSSAEPGGIVCGVFVGDLHQLARAGIIRIRLGGEDAPRHGFFHIHAVLQGEHRRRQFCHGFRGNASGPAVRAGSGRDLRQFRQAEGKVVLRYGGKTVVSHPIIQRKAGRIFLPRGGSALAVHRKDGQIVYLCDVLRSAAVTAFRWQFFHECQVVAGTCHIDILAVLALRRFNGDLNVFFADAEYRRPL